jgi:hypothetical protein
MEFYIQASNPRASGAYNAEDTNLAEAVETAFPLNTESAVLVWHHLYIALSYKYDLSVIINDLVSMLTALMRPGPGTHEVQWASNTFLSRWTLRWNAENDLAVDAEWTSVVGVPEFVVQKAGGVCMPKEQFVAEWKELLSRVMTALTASGYEEAQVAGLAELRLVHDQIPRRGMLYG